jgi:hypothetical protein
MPGRKIHTRTTHRLSLAGFGDSARVPIEIEAQRNDRHQEPRREENYDE